MNDPANSMAIPDSFVNLFRTCIFGQRENQHRKKVQSCDPEELSVRYSVSLLYFNLLLDAFRHFILMRSDSCPTGWTVNVAQNICYIVCDGMNMCLGNANTYSSSYASYCFRGQIRASGHILVLVHAYCIHLVCVSSSAWILPSLFEFWWINNYCAQHEIGKNGRSNENSNRWWMRSRYCMNACLAIHLSGSSYKEVVDRSLFQLFVIVVIIITLCLHIRTHAQSSYGAMLTFAYLYLLVFDVRNWLIQINV